VPPQGGRKHPNQDFVQIDTTNILFVCGGAFDGLEKIIRNRSEKSGIGFGATVTSASERAVGDLPARRGAEDLIKFGLIPNWSAACRSWRRSTTSEDAPVEILVAPKNALIKQFQRLFHMEGVELEVRARRPQVDRPKAIKRRPVRAACAPSSKASCST